MHLNEMKRSSRPLKAALLTALAGGSMALLGASPVRAAVLSFGNFPGGVFGGEGCADVQGGSLNNSTPVNANNCTAAPNQQFEFSGQTIYALGGQRCLDVNGANAGTPVDSYPCNGGINQQWAYTATSSGTGRIQPIGNTSLCLDATTGANGTQLMVNTCSSAPSQQWQIKATVLSFGDFPGGVFGGEGCADVQGGSLNNSTPVNAYNCTAAPNQQFEFSGQTIYALGGQRCLDVNGEAAGTPVDSYPCNGGINQQWTYSNGQIIKVTPPPARSCTPTATTCSASSIVTLPNGTTVVIPGQCSGGEECTISAASLLCLDATTGANGIQLVVNNCSGAASQQWQIK